VGYFKLGYRYYVDNGTEKGMNVDILEEFSKRTGCSFVTQEMSFARIWSDLASGDLDMSLSGIWSPERDKTLWCAPSITSKNYVVLGASARSSVKSEDDFLKNSKLQFGVVRGYTHGKALDVWLKKMREAGRVEESANVEVLFEKLKLGRLDGIFAFPFVYRKLLTELNMKGITAVQDWFPEEKGIIGCTMLTKSRFSEAEASRWRALIRQMQSDGTLKRIFNKYVSASEAEQMLAF
jgi:polar amino acid transport system substrate-binding protein